MQKQGIIPMYPEASQPFGKALDGGQMVDDDSENVEQKHFSSSSHKVQIQKCSASEVCNVVII